MTLLLFALGLALLIGGAELLVRGASRLATAAGIPPLVVGLTVVAFGTSAPELAVTTAATLRGDSAIALGNVVGSNILNVLLILGISAAVAPLVVQKRVVRLEVPIMIGISAIVVLFALDQGISRLEGLLLLGGGLVYTGGLVVQARRNGIENGDIESTAAPLTIAAALGYLALVGAGIALLVVGSRWIVEGATTMARALGVSDLVIGLTIISVGTSLPELATSILASVRNERDLAVGNIIGSNVFNLLIVLGTSAAVAPGGIVVPLSALTFDLPVMLAVALACLPIFFTGRRIDRMEGFTFLAFYVGYTLYLVLTATQHEAVDELGHALLFFALPLTALILALSVVRELRD
ncbi:MAG: calcium/sodium antiporter [Gemmatimonadota bacterium]